MENENIILGTELNTTTNPPINQPPKVETPRPKSNEGLIVFLVILVLILGSTTAFFAYKSLISSNNTPKQPTPIPTATPYLTNSTIPEQNLSPTSNPTSDIKNENNYANNRLGFSLKIPNSWEGFYKVEVVDNRVSFIFLSEDLNTPTYPLFGITKTTQQEWEAQVDEARKNSMPTPFFGEEPIETNGNDVFFFTPSIDNPFTGTDSDKYSTMMDDLKEIESSFNLVK